MLLMCDYNRMPPAQRRDWVKVYRLTFLTFITVTQMCAGISLLVPFTKIVVKYQRFKANLTKIYVDQKRMCLRFVSLLK